MLLGTILYLFVRLSLLKATHAANSRIVLPSRYLTRDLNSDPLFSEKLLDPPVSVAVSDSAIAQSTDIDRCVRGSAQSRGGNWSLSLQAVVGRSPLVGVPWM